MAARLGSSLEESSKHEQDMRSNKKAKTTVLAPRRVRTMGEPPSAGSFTAPSTTATPASSNPLLAAFAKATPGFDPNRPLPKPQSAFNITTSGGNKPSLSHKRTLVVPGHYDEHITGLMPSSAPRAKNKFSTGKQASMSSKPRASAFARKPSVAHLLPPSRHTSPSQTQQQASTSIPPATVRTGSSTPKTVNGSSSTSSLAVKQEMAPKSEKVGFAASFGAVLAGKPTSSSSSTVASLPSSSAFSTSTTTTRNSSSSGFSTTHAGDKEQFSGLKISNRVVSALVMEQRMEGRRAIKLPALERTLLDGRTGVKPQSSDYVVIGVLGDKSSSKASSKGNSYTIWRMYDLDSTSVAVFLFGDAYRACSTITEGTIIALLNPSVKPSPSNASSSTNFNRNEPALTLSVNSGAQVMKLGRSPDMGWCKAMKKNSNVPCNAIIHKNSGGYCQFHLTKAWASARSGRLELNGSFNGAAKRSTDRHQVPKSAQDLVASYGAKTPTTGVFVPKSKQTQAIVAAMMPAGSAGARLLSAAATNKKPIRGSAVIENAMSGALSMAASSLAAVRAASMTAEDEELEERGHALASRMGIVTENRGLIPASAFYPEAKETVKIERDDPLANPLSAAALQRKSQGDVAVARAKAVLAKLKSKGAQPGDKNWEKPKPPTKTQLEERKRAAAKIVSEENLAVQSLMSRSSAARAGADENRGPARGAALKAKRGDFTAKLMKKVGGAFSGEFAEALANPEGEAAARLMAARSVHADEVDEEELDRFAKVANVLQARDDLETKMASIMSESVTVYNCIPCGTMTVVQGEACKAAKHDCVVSKAKRRWFRCVGCGKRTTTLNLPYPNNPCYCGSDRFKAVGKGGHDRVRGMGEVYDEVLAPKFRPKGNEPSNNNM